MDGPGTARRFYDGAGLAERLAAEDADIAVVEADFVDGPFSSCPWSPWPPPGATPTTSPSPRRQRPACRCFAPLAVTPTPSPNLPSACSLPLPGPSCLLTATYRELEVFRDGTIPYQRFRGWELAGRNVAIIGYGAVGRAFEWRLRGLGMEVVVYDPYVAGAGHNLEEAVRGRTSFHSTLR